MNKLKSIAGMQILVLLVGIFAFTYAVGSEIGIVSAAAGDQFTYNNIDYIIMSSTKVVEKTQSDIQIIKDASSPCGPDTTTSSWFWDINNDGAWGTIEQTRYDAKEEICMFPAFVTAMNGAIAPQTTAIPPVSNGAPTQTASPMYPDGQLFLVVDGNAVPIEDDAVIDNDDGTQSLDTNNLVDDAKDLVEDAVTGATSAFIYEAVQNGITKIGQVLTTGPAGEAGVLPVKPTSFNLQGPTPIATGPEPSVFGDAIDTFGRSFFGGKGENFLIQPQGVWSWVGYLAQTYVVAAATAFAIDWAVRALGASNRNAQEITTTAIAAAIGTSVISTVLVAAGVGGPPGWVVAGVIVIISGISAFFTYQEYSKEVFTFQPMFWQPQNGGDDCNKCNELDYGCSEYQCHSFGKDCVLLNEGTSDEKCVANNPNDGTPPTIEALEGILESESYEYRESGIVSPPERGVKIFNTETEDGCLPAFSSVVLGVKTNEVAICKIDVERRQNYEEMISQMTRGGSAIYDFAHTVTIPNSATPSVDAMDYLGWDSENGRQQEFYIRCEDNNGNVAPMNFVIEFCIDDGPDTSAPQVLGTNYLSESYIQTGQASAPLEVYTNEPATCKWDYQNLDYDLMVNDMTGCSQNAEDYFAAYTYGCRGELTGLRDGEDNLFYIKCKDKPWLEGIEGSQDRVAMTDPYALTLKGTIPLELTSISANGQEEGENEILIKDSTNNIKVELEVETAAGAEQGLARCSYKVGNTYYDFYNEGSVEYVYPNTQELWLPEGNYEYEIKCMDKGGNTAEDSISFEVETDTIAPIVTRAYYEDDELILKTNEEAECVFDTRADTGCSFLIIDGTMMAGSEDGLTHSYSWNTNNNLYVKCQDEYGNQPSSGCSIIVRPFEFF
jgi:hypothetical protein